MSKRLRDYVAARARTEKQYEGWDGYHILASDRVKEFIGGPEGVTPELVRQRCVRETRIRNLAHVAMLFNLRDHEEEEQKGWDESSWVICRGITFGERIVELRPPVVKLETAQVPEEEWEETDTYGRPEFYDWVFMQVAERGTKVEPSPAPVFGVDPDKSCLLCKERERRREAAERHTEWRKR